MEDRFEELSLALRLSPIVKTFIEQDKIPCQIEKGLYLGSLGAANMRETLKTLNVTHVLTVRSSRAQFYPDDFVYKTILVKDRVSVNIRSYFDECFEFIDEARAGGGGVLVHCTVGISRSASVVVAYLMFKNGTSFSEVLQHVKLKRPMASPNIVKERDEVIEEMEKLKQRSRREKKEAFKLGFKAGAQSLLCSFEGKKCVSEPLVGRVRSFLQSPSCEASLDSLGDEDHLYRLERSTILTGYILEESATEGGDLDVVQAHHLDGHEAATAMPVGEDTPRDE